MAETDAVHPLRRVCLWGAVLLLGACNSEPPPASQRVIGGDPEIGIALVGHYGCGSCHEIPGVSGASGTVGPPLQRFGRRTYIGGTLPNRPENLTRFLQDPPALAPGTAMPNLGLSEQEARDVAAYLYTLR